jgi:hypothetical protein
MVSQWRVILLNFNPQVIEAADAATIEFLESRAPAVSSDDRNFLAQRFKSGSLFPLVGDPKMRRAIETATYRQGPILTMRTFANHIRVLGTRIFTPLHPLLGG